MKIIGINTSPRKKGNTQTLIETALEGASEKGAEAKLVNLRELNINGCIGCEGCKKHPGRCVQKDDLTPLMQEMTTFDAIVFGTPVYWFHVSAQFKILTDRLYSFLSYGENPETGESEFLSAFPEGRKALFIISRGDPEPAPLMPKFYTYMNEWLELIPMALRLEKHELFHQYGAQLDRKSALNDENLMKRAKEAGAGLFNTE